MSGTTAAPTGAAWRRVLCAAAVAGTIVWASGHTKVAAPGGFVGLDKLAHFAVFGLLATHVLRVPWVWRSGAMRAWFAIGVVSLFGLSDEWHQSFTPGRSVEWADWIADACGAATAVFVYLRWGGYRRALEFSFWPARRTAATVAQTAQA